MDDENKSKLDSECLPEKKEEEISLPQKDISLPQKEMKAFAYDEKKTVDENASDLMELKASQVALDDEQFVNDVADTKKKQIKESAKANKDIHLAKKEAEKVNALTEIDKAFYEKWKVPLQFGGIQEATTRGFSIFMLFLILPFFTVLTLCIIMPINMIKTLFKAINKLFLEIDEFGKVGRSICLTLLILLGMFLVAVIVISLLYKFGIINWNLFSFIDYIII